MKCHWCNEPLVFKRGRGWVHLEGGTYALAGGQGLPTLLLSDVHNAGAQKSWMTIALSPYRMKPESPGGGTGTPAGGAVFLRRANHTRR